MSLSTGLVGTGRDTEVRAAGVRYVAWIEFRDVHMKSRFPANRLTAYAAGDALSRLSAPSFRAVQSRMSLRSLVTLSPPEGKLYASSTPFGRSSSAASSMTSCRSEGR